MLNLARWMKSIVPAALIVLFVWTAALADHANITFSQTNNTAGGTAIQGLATGAADATHGAVGVVGRSTQADGIGVWGRATAASGGGWGVVGDAASLGGVGVLGRAAATTSRAIGVVGEAVSPAGIGVYGVNLAPGSVDAGRGVVGETNSEIGIGVQGVAKAAAGFAIGVWGQSAADFGQGVYGVASAEAGTTIGVRGQVRSVSGTGVEGFANAPSGNTKGVWGHTNSPSGTGVLGTGGRYGVRGESSSSKGVGVYGESKTGVRGVSKVSGGIGVWGVGPSSGRAGRFDGRVDINCPQSKCLYVNGVGIADLAEDMPVAGTVGPGDAVVLAKDRDGIVIASRPYDTMVAGIVSASPRIHFGVRGRGPTAPVGMTGIVRANASAANGAIRRGDLLTTSAIPGHLMRCSSPARCVGAIVAKAMQPLARGNGQILVLLWRQ